MVANPAIVQAWNLPGSSDAGVKIASAIATFGSGGGIVDATGFTGSQNLTGFTISRGVSVYMGPCLYTMPAASPSIIIREGGRLIGCSTNSPGATQITAASGFNKDMIQCLSTAGTTGWWHHGEVCGLRLEGNKAGNTSGNCLSVWGVGEVAMIHRCIFQNAANACLYMHGSQAGTGTIENITVNAGGAYGALFDAFTSGLTLKSVGGDANPITLGFINGSTGGSVYVQDFKMEGAFTPVVRISGGGGSSVMTVTFVGGNVNTGGTPATTFLEIAADVQIANHKINIMGLATAAHMTTLIDDKKLGHTVTCADVVNHSLVCYDGAQSPALFAAFPGVYTYT